VLEFVGDPRPVLRTPLDVVHISSKPQSFTWDMLISRAILFNGLGRTFTAATSSPVLEFASIRFDRGA
jgi:hypothetical protein